MTQVYNGKNIFVVEKQYVIYDILDLPRQKTVLVIGKFEISRLTFTHRIERSILVISLLVEKKKSIRLFKNALILADTCKKTQG